MSSIPALPAVQSSIPVAAAPRFGGSIGLINDHQHVRPAPSTASPVASPVASVGIGLLNDHRHVRPAPLESTAVASSPRLFGQDRLPDAIPFPVPAQPEPPTSPIVQPTPKYV